MSEYEDIWEHTFSSKNVKADDEWKKSKEDRLECTADKQKNMTVLKDAENFLRQMESSTYQFREQFLQMQSAELLQAGLRDIDDVYRDKGMYSYEKEITGIEISEYNSCIRIVLPALLPHRRSKPECLFAKPLFIAANEFMMNGKGKDFQEKSKNGVLAVICHSYRADYMVRDNDNIEIKSVLDTLVLARMLPSDRGDFLSVLSMANKGQKENQCFIILIPKEHTMITEVWQDLQKLLDEKEKENNKENDDDRTTGSYRNNEAGL